MNGTVGSAAGRREGWFFAVALLAQLALAIFPYSATGLLAPLGGIVAAYVLWAAVTVALVRFRSRGALTLLAPVVSVAVWYGLMTFGDLVLGWTA